MTRSLLIAVLLATTGVAAQAAGGPPIAYVKAASNGDEIHLVSPDGTERLLIYKARSKIQIRMLDLRPGGGEVAFLENLYALKILAFDDYGRPLPGNPREIRRVSSPCGLESPDYHPTNGTLLFGEGCGRDRAIWTVQSGASQRDASPLLSSFAVFRARWSRLGDFIYYVGLRDNAGTNDPVYLYRRTTGPGTPDELGPLDGFSTFDVARQGEKVFWSVGNGTFKLLDLGVAGATTVTAPVLECPRGMRMSYSPSDSEMVYSTSASNGGNYVMVGPTNCGTPSRLTGKGSWGWVDWRPDPVTP